MLENFDMYGEYGDLVRNGNITIHTSSLNTSNIDTHFESIMNIMKDGVELEEVHKMRVHIIFQDNEQCSLSIFDYWLNLIFWSLNVKVNAPILSVHLFYSMNGINANTIKSYIDNLFIRRYRESINRVVINNILDDCIYKLRNVNKFALYLANSVNFEDTIDLMRKYPEFNESMHLDLSGENIEDVKEKGMEYARKQIEYIKNSDHCLRDSFVSQQAINIKQYKEVAVNIGTKPYGSGVYPYVINNSFMNGGVSNPISYLIESSVGRTAQILQKMNVGTSGAFARLLELNNIDTFLHEDPNYSCKTRNYEEVTIRDEKWLNAFDTRYYKIKKDGPLYKLNKFSDKHLIGQTLLFRSPMTCASFAKGHGICRKCYGDLYYFMRDINAGKIAAELLSAIYTQILLSAKHLLESAIVKMNWVNDFTNVLELNLNILNTIEDFDYKGYYLIIDESNISYEDENDDDLDYNEYVTKFDIQANDGTITPICTEDGDSIYISEILNKAINNAKITKYSDGKYYVPMDKVVDVPLFYINIQNKELSRTLKRANNILNKSDETSKYDRNTILNTFIGTNMDGGINLNSIHYEIILANQIRDSENILEKPNWEIENVAYDILALNKSLTNNPSITIALLYQRIARTLVNPLSRNKTKPSVFDVFFAEKPQEFINNKNMVSNKFRQTDDREDSNMKQAVHFYNSTGDEIIP